MNIILFGHPKFQVHQSMPRYLNMLSEGLKERGHAVEIWAPEAIFFKIPVLKSLRKWLGYIDQFIVFPIKVRRRIKSQPPDTLYVLTDQALGPWMPLIEGHYHVIHCHDFLALLSALGEIPEFKTRWTGRKYQDYIRRGFTKGSNFISVSKNTKALLNQFVHFEPKKSEVVYNGLNRIFKPFDMAQAQSEIERITGIPVGSGYILHVGGNQWYKNRKGVIEIYNAWRTSNNIRLPLLLIGETPAKHLLQFRLQSPFSGDIYFLNDIPDSLVRLAYAGATVFLFPSLAEGFGWPIAEAMGTGCPVITTGNPPMTEVGGDAAFFIPKRPNDEKLIFAWAENAAKVINNIISLKANERQLLIENGLLNVERFRSSKTIDQIEKIYYEIVQGN